MPTFKAGTLALDLELLLLLAYLFVLWVAGWVLELLARAHFNRAQKYAHAGFAYDVRLDRFECSEGELLTLHGYDERKKLAVYKAPAASCNACVKKALCTPHDEGRHIYRSSAAFHETDVGRFHRGLSFVILTVALAFSVGGLFAWWNKPGQWLLLIATDLSLLLLWLDIRDALGKSRMEPRAGSPRQGW
jgi:hypothetical protein